MCCRSWRLSVSAASMTTASAESDVCERWRKMVGEARRAGMVGQEEAAGLTDVPNISQKGTRLGNWLTREQAKELLYVPRPLDPEREARLRHPGTSGRLRCEAE
jgi:hypothetical protein